MTDAKHDDALGELGQRILKRLDTQLVGCEVIREKAK